jgi:hypothetical protein
MHLVRLLKRGATLAQAALRVSCPAIRGAQKRTEGHTPATLGDQVIHPTPDRLSYQHSKLANTLPGDFALRATICWSDPVSSMILMPDAVKVASL